MCDGDCREFKDKDCPFDKWHINEWSFRRCPKQYVTDDMTGWLRAYQMFKRGYLPNDKAGWLNQANKFIEIVEFIDIQLERYRSEMEKKAHG